ncbi:MAG: SDR family NAD(P)-dependent oxidoreductase, partial [Candidatus Dormibacteraeota bacterium]|nr:SDR family NAD(P)-dependent oxidoreductase [Candidatus Dormibacteraeota bacterium]
MSSTEKIALVTGAGTGIGRAVSLALAAAGFAVVLSGRRPQPLESVAEEGKRTGARLVAVPADVGDPASVAALFNNVRQTFGRLDLLFNNAGRGAPGLPLEDLPYEDWKSVVDTNLTGAFLCTQQAFRIMKDQQPRGG